MQDFPSLLKALKRRPSSPPWRGPEGGVGLSNPLTLPFHPFSHSPILFPLCALCASARLSSSSHSIFSPRRQDRQGNLRLVAIIVIPNPSLRPLRLRESPLLSHHIINVTPFNRALPPNLQPAYRQSFRQRFSPSPLLPLSDSLSPLRPPRLCETPILCITPSPPSLSLSLTVLTVKID